MSENRCERLWVHVLAARRVRLRAPGIGACEEHSEHRIACDGTDATLCPWAAHYDAVAASAKLADQGLWNPILKRDLTRF